MIENLLCRTLGCMSPLARWFGWPHGVCNWYLARGAQR